MIHRTPPATAHPPLQLGILAGVLALTVAAVATFAWTLSTRLSPLERAHERFEHASTPRATPAPHLPPVEWGASIEPRRWSWDNPDHRRVSLEPETFLDRAVRDAYREKTSREARFAGAVHAPTLVGEPTASTGAVDIRWTPPSGLPALRARVDSDPLLTVDYRLYRWREGEEPQLVGSCDIARTSFQDTDLPLWRERLYYAVATELRGEFSGITTLLAAERSAVVPVFTVENFRIDVLPMPVDESDTASAASPTLDQVDVDISTRRDGSWERERFVARRGERLGGVRTVDGVDRDFDTGLDVLDMVVHVGSRTETAQRPEFLPDGRRKLDPTTGEPVSRTQARPRRTHTVELLCRDRTLEERSFRSTVHH